MLEIKLFGSGKLNYDWQTLVGFPCQQCWLLLCYLLLNRDYPHHREHLAAIFWADCPRCTSLKHLSKVLWRLHERLQSFGVPLEEYLDFGKEMVSFRCPPDRYWLDVEAFEAAITRYQNFSGQALTPEQARLLEEAVKLYVGDLLEGTYEDWCVCERERLGLLYVEALSKLMIFHEFNGTYESGLSYGQRLLARDNTYEKAHRQMMRLYWLIGNRGAALAQYQACVQVLRDELGATPLQETRWLYEQMLHNNFQAGCHYETVLEGAIKPELPVQQIAERTLNELARLEAIMTESRVELQNLKQSLEALIRIASAESNVGVTPG